MGFKNLAFEVQGAGCRVHGAWCRVQGMWQGTGVLGSRPDEVQGPFPSESSEPLPGEERKTTFRSKPMKP